MNKKQQTLFDVITKNCEIDPQVLEENLIDREVGYKDHTSYIQYLNKEGNPVEIGLGRYMRTILKIGDPVARERIIEAFKLATWTFKVNILTGGDIETAYLTSNGKFDSCMTHPENSSLLQMYVDNPQVVSLAVLTLDKDPSLAARCLLWRCKDADGGDVLFGDRVYGNHEPRKQLERWCKDKCDDWRNCTGHPDIPCRIKTHKEQTLYVTIPRPNKHPFADSFCYVVCDEETTTLSNELTVNTTGMLTSTYGDINGVSDFVKICKCCNSRFVRYDSHGGVCRDCAANHGRCIHCSNLTLLDKLKSVAEGLVCEGCYKYLYGKCGYCGDIRPGGTCKLGKLGEETFLCNTCRSVKYAWCSCDNHFLFEETTPSPAGPRLCSGCVDKKKAIACECGKSKWENSGTAFYELGNTIFCSRCVVAKEVH